MDCSIANNGFSNISFIAALFTNTSNLPYRIQYSPFCTFQGHPVSNIHPNRQMPVTERRHHGPRRLLIQIRHHYLRSRRRQGLAMLSSQQPASSGHDRHHFRQ